MKGRPSIVTNTGPLIAHAGVGQLVLLDALFHVIVPEAVASEFAVGKAGLGSDEARRELQGFAEFAGPAIVDPLLAVELDSGEASVIQTARNLGINLVLMDERKGRRLARRVYGLQTVGSVRVLVEAKQLGHLPAVAPVLGQMKTAGYWIADDIVTWAKAVAGE